MLFHNFQIKMENILGYIEYVIVKNVLTIYYNNVTNKLLQRTLFTVFTVFRLLTDFCLFIYL